MTDEEEIAFELRGYLVVPNLIDSERVRALCDALLRIRDDPRTREAPDARRPGHAYEEMPF
jgi:hypothetical protein